MKIIFFGSSDFAVPVLKALNDKEDIVLAVTQPDRKKGRQLHLTPTPIKKETDMLSIKTFQPDSVNDSSSIQYLERFDADLFVVVSFGEILRNNVLDIPKFYSINLHASLLPKYRGAAPVNWVIANGDRETGVSIIKMNEEMDEGDIIMKESVSIDCDEDAITLSTKLSQKGALLLMSAIDLIKARKERFVKQNEKEASFAPKLKKQDGIIDWAWDADKICNRIRAFIPWPGCWTYCGKKMIKIWTARPIKHEETITSKDGEVVEVTKDRIVVNTGGGFLAIEELQLEGSRRMKVREFIAGHKGMITGVRFGP